MDEELEEVVEDENVNTDEEGEPEDPGDAGDSTPVDQEPVPPVEDEGVRPDVDWDETIADGEARVPQHFTSQPVPPYYIGDDWDDDGEMYICIGDSTGETFDAADWSPVVEQEVIPPTTTVTRYTVEPITDYSAEKLAEYEQSGATAWAIYDDGSRVQVQWSEVTEPVLPGVAADEALEAALANGQHFWHNSDGAETHGGAGVHVTDQTQEVWDAAVADGFSDLSDSKPYHNILINSLGMLLRTALNHLASITRSAIAFFDGEGNDSSNLVASFGKDGAQIGKSEESHIEMDYHSMRLIDWEQESYFYVSDLRDHTGIAEITEYVIGDGETRAFRIQVEGVVSSVKVDDEEITNYSAYDMGVTIHEPPERGAVVEIKYTTTSKYAKAYTLGTRSSLRTPTVGLMSYVLGGMCAAGGAYSVAEGFNNGALGTMSHAEGSYSEASGACSHAEGQSIASGTSAHSEGNLTQANGARSHAEGNHTVADASSAHAEGIYTKALANGAHSEGYYSIAYDNRSHAEGDTCRAHGVASHAQNMWTVTNMDAQTAIGKYNAQGNYAFIVGNGTADDARSNALTVDWSGNVETAGDITAQGFFGTGDIVLKDPVIDRDAAAPTSNQIGGVVRFKDKDGERLGQVEIDRLKSGMTQLRIGAFSESGGTEDQTWLDLQSDPDGDLDCITTGKTVILSKTTDASGTADNRPALIVGGTPGQAHLEFDSNEILAKADGDSTATLWLNTDGGTVGFGGNAQVTGHQFIAKSDNIASGSAVSSATNGNGSYRLFGSDGVPLGMINARFLNTGEQGVQMYTTRKVGTADKYNTLALYLDEDGNPTVTVTNQKSWRDGLGITPANIGAAASSHTHNYLPLTGGEVTGDVYVKSSNITVGTTPSSHTNGSGVSFRDSKGTGVAYTHARFLNDGRTGYEIGTVRSVSGSNVFHSLGLFIDKDGDKSIVVSDAAAWRSAIGAAASSHTHSYLPLGGGTMTGQIRMKNETAMPRATGTGWFPVVINSFSDGGEMHYMRPADVPELIGAYPASTTKSSSASIFTAGANVTVTSVYHALTAGVFTFTLQVKTTAKFTSGATNDLGYFHAGYRPYGASFNAQTGNPQQGDGAWVTTGGTVRYKAPHDIASGSTLYVSATYVVA